MDNNKLLEKQKKAYRFNIIDLILIVLIVGAAAILAYIMLGTSILTGGEDTTIIYTIEVPLIKNDFIPAINKIKAGDKIIDSVRSYDIGLVQEVKITDAYSNNTDMEVGVVYSKPYPDYSNVKITVKTKCKKEQARYVANGKTIMVGTVINFRTSNFVSYGNCIYLEEISEQTSENSTTATEANTAEDVSGVQ